MEGIDRNKQYPDQFYEVMSLLLSYFSQLYLVEPEENFIDKLKSGELFKNFPLEFKGKENLKILEELRVETEKADSEYLAKVKEDFTNMFLVSDKKSVPPFASVYLDEEGILFDKTTLEVRKYYSAYKLEFPLQNKIPEDHLGFMLSFLSILCNRIYLSADANDYTQLKKSVKRFTAKYILSWMEKFLFLVEKNSNVPFYFLNTKLLALTLHTLQMYDSNN